VPLARRILDLSDPAVAETRQPYHRGARMGQEDDVEIARLAKVIERCARRSLADWLAAGLFDGRSCRRAAVVVGSLIDPASVGNLHIRAHASEGRLFRTVVEQALRDRGIDCTVIVEKTLGARAKTTLRQQEAQIRKTVARFGGALEGPWRVEEKAAATAAWIVLD
jgi:hypothetical protein